MSSSDDSGSDDSNALSSRDARSGVVRVAFFGLSPFMIWAFGVGAWFFHQGLQFVLIPTLVIVTLGLGAAELSYAQIALLMPQLVLLLFTGNLAERVNNRRLLVITQFFAAIPPAVIFWLLLNGRLTYEAIILYSIGIGVAFSFVLPAREALLARVRTYEIQRGVVIALLVQFCSQLGGYVVAGLTAPFFGPLALPLIQAVALIFGMAVSFLLPDYSPLAVGGDDEPSRMEQLLGGIRAVRQSETLYPVILATLAVGILFVGVVMVSLPLITRDVFGGGQVEISVVIFCFWGGAISSMLFLMFRQNVVRRGRALCLGTLAGAFSLFVVTQAPNFLIFCIFCYCWGLAAGVNMSMSRTIVQVEVAPEVRARVLALYNLSFVGAAPLGAAFLGFLSVQLGPQQAPIVSSICMICFCLWLSLMTPAWRIVRPADEV